MIHQNQSIRLIFFLFILFQSATAYVNSFDVADYEQFLKSNEDLTADELLSQYPADRFFEKIMEVDLSNALYGDIIDEHYALTEDEKSLLKKHGFVVTERLSRESFGGAFAEIYEKDLPVFVSTDSILHALHMSYDAILMDVELSMLIPKLNELLTTLHEQVPTLAERYESEPLLLPMLKDLDVYLTVTRILLGKSVSPVYPENEETIKELLGAIAAEQPVRYKLFSSTPRDIDFSQFTPRGHYTQLPELTKYFQAMIWLGRTEMYLTAPKQGNPLLQQKEEDIQRQTIDAALLAEAADTGDAFALLSEIDNTIKFMVGESDNVKLEHIRMLMNETGVQNASQLLKVPVWKNFQVALLEKPYSVQHILSQMLVSPSALEQIEPASAFLLLGQRFAIDSFITGNVVYDKIIFNDTTVRRMLPSSLDVLFALGNNASAQLLKTELKEYHYAPNLASLRFLIDTYTLESWDDSLYNGWLNAIRTLNPPEERESYPPFMQTAAWWQEKMNTQLAAWAQLRHDNLLYVKQSYTGMTVCSFPESFVEPVPEFYDAVKRLADNAVRNFQNVTFVNYFKHMSEVADTLADIARKELDNTPLLPDEKDFLKRMLYDSGFGSGPRYDGWYPKLFITGENDGLMKEDYVVADVHTAPTDEFGNPVGYVMHAGTGPINLAVMVCDMPDSQPVAFIGPVMSYYERITTGFKRLTDEEWQTEYAKPPSYRPPFVNLYLADKAGRMRGESISLFTRTGTPPADVQPRWDVNDDGSVDILDLVLVGQHFGELPPKELRADVNEDGIVDIFDLVLIGGHFGESYTLAAPNVWTKDYSQYLSELKDLCALIDENSHPSAVELKLLLQKLIALAEKHIQSKTSLEQNYPNPFNPDTWIPYNLAADAKVTITIYNAKGQQIRALSLGAQPAGSYLTKDKAVYWDGRNDRGELVSSGVYFYQLQVGDFSAIKKMILLK